MGSKFFRFFTSRNISLIMLKKLAKKKIQKKSNYVNRINWLQFRRIISLNLYPPDLLVGLHMIIRMRVNLDSHHEIEQPSIYENNSTATYIALCSVYFIFPFFTFPQDLGRLKWIWQSISCRVLSAHHNIFSLFVDKKWYFLIFIPAIHCACAHFGTNFHEFYKNFFWKLSFS